MAFIVKNKTGNPVILPSPVGMDLAPNDEINLSAVVPAANIVAIVPYLNRLEQQGIISIVGVPDTEEDIEEAAEESGHDTIDPMIIMDAMAEERAIQIPLWNGSTATAGSPKTMKFCITDDGGSPSLLGTHTPTMTLTVSGVTNAKISAGSTILPGAVASAQVTIAQGMATFTVQGDAGTMDIVVTGTPPVNPVTGETLLISNGVGSPYQITIS